MLICDFLHLFYNLKLGFIICHKEKIVTTPKHQNKRFGLHLTENIDIIQKVKIRQGLKRSNISKSSKQCRTLKKKKIIRFITKKPMFQEDCKIKLKLTINWSGGFCLERNYNNALHCV